MIEWRPQEPDDWCSRIREKVKEVVTKAPNFQNQFTAENVIWYGQIPILGQRINIPDTRRRQSNLCFIAMEPKHLIDKLRYRLETLAWRSVWSRIYGWAFNNGPLSQLDPNTTYIDDYYSVVHRMVDMCVTIRNELKGPWKVIQINLG